MSDLSQHAVAQNIPSTGYSSQQLFEKTILLWLLLLQLLFRDCPDTVGNYATYSAINVCTMITPHFKGKGTATGFVLCGAVELYQLQGKL